MAGEKFYGCLIPKNVKYTWVLCYISKGILVGPEYDKDSILGDKNFDTAL
jgi:hypothetical protein